MIESSKLYMVEPPNRFCPARGMLKHRRGHFSGLATG
jgi:hypothetical protein